MQPLPRNKQTEKGEMKSNRVFISLRYAVVCNVFSQEFKTGLKNNTFAQNAASAQGL